MKQNVLGFNISMNYIAIMHKLNSMTNLSDHPSHSLLCKTTLFPQRRIDISSAAGFENEIKIILVTEKGI